MHHDYTKYAISPYTAKLFDEKIDDGNPKTGNVYMRSYSFWGPYYGEVPENYDNAENLKDDKNYFLNFVLSL